MNPPRDRDEALALSETLAGPTVDALKVWCAKTGAYIIAGMVERDGDQLYNTLVLVGSDTVHGRYRKTHQGGQDQVWATAGDSLTLVDTPLGRIGLLAGTDLLHPEPLRCLAIGGADLVCVSAALSGPLPITRRQINNPGEDAIHWHLARTRAAENDVYVAFANRYASGTDCTYMGHSGIFFGPVLFEEPAQEVFAMEVSGSDFRAARMEIDTRAGHAIRSKPSLARRLPANYVPPLKRNAL
jgi:predicted amidohydrolase